MANLWRRTKKKNTGFHVYINVKQLNQQAGMIEFLVVHEVPLPYELAH